MEIGEKIRSERKRTKMTLDQLAKKIGVSKMTIHRIETGKTSPSIAILGDIAEALHTPISRFIEEGTPLIVINRKEQHFSVEGDNLIATNVFPRRLLSSLNSETMAINYVEAENGAVVEKHTNKGYEWVFQISGQSVLRYDKNEYICNSGDVFFYDATRAHSVKYLGTNKFLLISFK